MDAVLIIEALYQSFAEGLNRWHGFAEACLSETGPAGVFSHGRSAAEASRWSEADRWRGVWTGNPMEVVRVTGHSRLAVSTSHVSGLSALLASGSVSASVATVLRACAETSARALWILDPALSPRDAIARALTESIHDLGHLTGRARERGQASLGKIVEFADRAGWVVRRDRKFNTPIGILQGRPDANDLLRKLDEQRGSSPFGEVLDHFRRSGNAATHGRFLAFVELISSGGDPVLGAMMARPCSVHIVYALDLHLRALDAWNASIAWNPSDLFDDCRKAAFAGVLLPYLELVRAHSRVE